MAKSKVFYKYKSLDNFEFLLDLLLRERLYAALHHELNDPMEGVVKIDGTVPKGKEQEWDSLLKTFRIACFSRDKDNTLMWAHYADGARGCVVEFELLDDHKVHDISYLKKPSLNNGNITRDKAKEILLYKEKPWKYEAESRCLVEGGEVFLPIRVKSVRFGSRAERSRVDILKGILSLCKPEIDIRYRSEQKMLAAFSVEMSKTRVHMQDRIRTQDYCPQCSEVRALQKMFINGGRNNHS